MSPSYFYVGNSNIWAYVFHVRGSGSYPGYLSNDTVNDAYVVRPVVSLKAEVEVTGGDGSANDPYIVSMPWQK